MDENLESLIQSYLKNRKKFTELQVKVKKLIILIYNHSFLKRISFIKLSKASRSSIQKVLLNLYKTPYIQYFSFRYRTQRPQTVKKHHITKHFNFFIKEKTSWSTKKVLSRSVTSVVLRSSTSNQQRTLPISFPGTTEHLNWFFVWPITLLLLIFGVCYKLNVIFYRKLK